MKPERGDMLISKPYLVTLALVIFACLSAFACAVGDVKTFSNQPLSKTAGQYSWTKVTDKAAFPGSYNFPVFTVRNQMWAFHPQGNWSSTDGRTWTKSELPASGLNSGYQKYVQFNDAVYALGTMEGDYTNLHVGSRIARTIDFKRWEL